MVSLPVATVVSTIYWTCISFAPHLVLPSSRRTSSEPSSAAAASSLYWIPLQTDLAAHLFPGLMLSFEFFCMEGKYAGNELKRDAGIITALYCILYSGWVEYLAPINNRCKHSFIFLL